MAEYKGPVVPVVPTDKAFEFTSKEVNLLRNMLNVSEHTLMKPPYNLTKAEAQLSFEIWKSIYKASKEI